MEQACLLASGLGRGGLHRLASRASPDPDSIIGATSELDECEGVLFDTWDKTGGMRLDRTWKPRVDRVRDTGRFVALAGSLDIDAIKRLAVLEPDIFAVRGAACVGGDRLKTVDSQQVSELARAVGQCYVSLTASFSHIEPDPLRQRQLASVVDRAGLAAHIRFPRVRAGLAPAPCGLLASERAANLGPGRADVDIGDPAIRTFGRKETMRLA